MCACTCKFRTKIKSVGKEAFSEQCGIPTSAGGRAARREHHPATAPRISLPQAPFGCLGVPALLALGSEVLGMESLLRVAPFKAFSADSLTAKERAQSLQGKRDFDLPPPEKKKFSPRLIYNLRHTKTGLESQPSETCPNTWKKSPLYLIHFPGFVRSDYNPRQWT